MTDANTQANSYLRTRVMTASPEELRLLLLEGAVKFARQARDGLADKDFDLSHSGFTQCRAIVLELLNTIKPEAAPELAEQVGSLYAYIYSELVGASIEKSVEQVDEIVRLLDYERETWVLLMEKVAEERAQTRAPEATPAPEGPHRSLSVQA